MTTTEDQISVVLSGGSTNINVNESLGGDPSATPITDGTLNNLFDDVTPDEGESGNEDYRCIYIFNDGDTTVFNMKLWIASEVESGCEIEIGMADEDERQRIAIAGSVTGGSLTLSYRSRTFTISYNSDLSVWANELQSELDALTDGDDNLFFSDVTVTAQAVGTFTLFDVYFTGNDGSRDHPLFVVSTNSLTPTPSIAISAIQEGAPVNTVAPEIDADVTPPSGVTFSTPSEFEPLTISKLESEDGFPIWIKRVVPVGVAATEGDGFVLRISAETLEP